MTVPAFYVAEDGEVVGMLRRFSARFGLTPASVLECLRRRAPRTVVMEAGEGGHRWLVLSADGLMALHECASSERLPATRR
jgi:hypothetical protein